MRRQLTEQEIADYDACGFVAIADLLDEDELAHWRDVVDEAIAADLTWQPEGSDPMVFTQRMNLRRVSGTIRELVEDPRVGRLVADLERLDAVRVYLDQVLVKEPYSLPTSFHVDLPWWAFESAHACTIWIALDDATIENGCLYFVPGSHRRPLAHRSTSLGAGVGAIFAAHPETAERAPVPCPVPAGGATIHNARTIHGAGANMTPGRRRVITTAFMPDGVRYDGTRDERSQGADFLDTLVEGDLLGDDERHPLVFSRCEAGVHA